MFNFDKVVDRSNTDSKKWGFLKETFGHDDVIPMWVADMDFKTAPCIIEALNKGVSHGVFGYSAPNEEYYTSIINWMKNHHDLEIKKEWICLAPTIVSAISFIIQSYTNEGDKIIVQPPVYHRFKSCIESNNREMINNPLKLVYGKYYMDFEDLESKIDEKVKIILLCSPHNPVGRVWTKEELTKLGEICRKHNILVVSDEIHSDLVFSGYKHTSLINIDEELKDNCILCTAPTKTFNIAGIQVSNVIIPNNNLREKYLNTLSKNAIGDLNCFATDVLIAAYNEGEQWYREMLNYIEENFRYLDEYLKENLPQIKLIKAEGTYLAWIDFRALNMSDEKLKEFMINKARVVFNDGIMFGEEGSGFQRVNLGCSREILKQALDRIFRSLQ